jgi:hypothetical protein
MVSPLQQDLEMKKAANGKSSPIIQDLTQDEVDADGSQSDEEDTQNNKSVF